MIKWRFIFFKIMKINKIMIAGILNHYNKTIEGEDYFYDYLTVNRITSDGEAEITVACDDGDGWCYNEDTHYVKFDFKLNKVEYLMHSQELGEKIRENAMNHGFIPFIAFYCSGENDDYEPRDVVEGFYDSSDISKIIGVSDEEFLHYLHKKLPVERIEEIEQMVDAITPASVSYCGDSARTPCPLFQGKGMCNYRVGKNGCSNKRNS